MLKPNSVVPVRDVPLGSYFRMKLQNREVYHGFMARQIARRDGDFSGPVVLILPEVGQFALPRPATTYQLAVAAVFSGVEPFVDFDALEASSTEAMRLSSGRLLAAGEDFLFALPESDLNYDNFVSLNTGDMTLGGDAGDWLAFTRWGLRLSDGTVVYSHDARAS